MSEITQLLEEKKLPMFQTFDSVDEAKAYIDMKLLRDEPSNKVHTALAIYHNTLLSQLVKEIPHETV